MWILFASIGLTSLLLFLQLDLSGCVRIGHEGLGALSAGCKVLRTLDLSNCKNVDDDAMKVQLLPRWWGQQHIMTAFLTHNFVAVLCDSKALHGELANLEILTLSGCRRITGASGRAVPPVEGSVQRLCSLCVM